MTFGSECPSTSILKKVSFDLIVILNDGSSCSSILFFTSSVSPIFISAGKGLKKGCLTNRVIRQVDVAATIAHLGGVRMPAECEGAPIYQILEEEM